MKIGIYDFPDECPSACKLKCTGFYQGSICSRCPVFNCGGNDNILSPDEYRLDWAKEWDNFFNTGETPILYLEYKGCNNE